LPFLMRQKLYSIPFKQSHISCGWGAVD